MTTARYARLLVQINGAVPVALLTFAAWRDRLGYNPSAYLLRTSGLLALIFLLLSLCVTPLRRITGRNFFSLFRRTLGLYAFFYACLHVLMYLWLDQGFDLLNVPADVWRRKFILLGMLAFLLLIPLAATSTAGMVKRLGAVRWKRLHQLVYVAAAAGVIHYALRAKVLETQPMLFVVAAGVLLGFRAVWGIGGASHSRKSAGRVG